MTTLNLGILAHVDAGKTSLTERLLYAAGVIDRIGRVDDGSTQTDSMALERQRGITIRSAVVSFAIDDLTVNLIDTPGHPDFIAEVERVLSVLDGAILVISAVEGVQAQTRILLRALRRLRVPTLIFVNKVDRTGARYPGVLDEIRARLVPEIVPLTVVDAAGGRDAVALPSRDEDRSRWLDMLTRYDDDLLAAYVDGDTVGAAELDRSLAHATARAEVHPVFAGSAVTGTGIDALIRGIRDLLPAADEDPDAPLAGLIFKIDRGPAGEKLAYARMFAGTVRVRDRIQPGAGADRDARARNRITGLAVFDRGPATPATELRAGQIGVLRGLATARIGDPIGASAATRDGYRFAPPTLETVVVPARPGDRGAVRAALAQLAEQDPLIGLRQDDRRRELYLSLYGEVQKEVVQATLENDFGLAVSFRETTTVCIERPTDTGRAFEVIATEPNPFLATVGLRVEPGPVGSGVRFVLGIELGSLPLAFITAVEETVRRTLREGLRGWEVTDVVVTLERSGYWARQSHMGGGFDKSMSSTAGDFRNLTPLVLMSALRRAGTAVLEPMQDFRLEVPADTLGPVVSELGRLGASVGTPEVSGTVCVLSGHLRVEVVPDLEHRLPTLARGEALLECAFGHYAPVRGPVPSRPRTDHNPLNRKEYLLHVARVA